MRFQKGNKIGHRFKKGEVTNPNGRPVSITTEVRKKLRTLPKGQKKTYLILFIDEILHKAIVKGDNNMIELIWKYMDGMPGQPGDIDRPAKYIFEYAK